MMAFLLRAAGRALAEPRAPVSWPRASLAVGLSCASWTLLYRCLGRTWPRAGPEWRCRTVTLTHALVIAAASVWAFAGDSKWPFSDAVHGRPNSWREQATAAVCLGYFLFDLSWCLWHRTEGPLMLCHHACSVLGLSASLFAGRWGCELLLVTLLTELSNPLLQARWLLLHGAVSGLNPSRRQRLVRRCELAFFLVFSVARIGLGTPLLFRYFRNPRTDALGRAGAGVMYAISWAFWVNIFALGLRSVRGQHWRAARPGSGSKNGASVRAKAD